MPGPGVVSSYGPGRALTSTVRREGVDIGPQPDFWGDLNQIVSRLKPKSSGSAVQQAQALRMPEVSDEDVRRSFNYNPGEAIFGSAIGQGPNSAGVAYSPYLGGAVSPNSLFAMGHSRRPIIPPQNAYLIPQG